ncbi:Nuclear envelope morphology protein 1, partial [Coemansia helicoidea]
MAVPERPRSRFSVVSFAAIYLYTLLFDILAATPFLESLLLHLPQPQDLVDDAYQPISDRTPIPDPGRAAAAAASADAAGGLHEQRPLRRRRASSGASSSAESSLGAAAGASTHADDADDGRRAHSPASAGSTPAGLSSARGGGPVSRGPAKKTLVLDLDETLIHSSPQGSYRAHHRIEVVIDKVACLYYVYKRPHVDYFLHKVSEWYTVVVFTASLAEYADPVIDLLDAQR